jgi:hypothetical protein
MHNQGDSDDPKQNEFDDLKQDLQLLKYDMLNDLKKSREDNMRNMFIINGGIQFLAEEILNNNINKENIDSAFARYRELLNNHNNILQSDSESSVFDHKPITPPSSNLILDRQTSSGSESAAAASTEISSSIGTMKSNDADYEGSFCNQNKIKMKIIFI